MSSDENEWQTTETSDYFSESTPKSIKSMNFDHNFDHKYSLSPSLSLVTTSSGSQSTSGLSSNDSNSNSIKKQKLFKRRRLFGKDSETKTNQTNITPLSERQQLAIALQLSSDLSSHPSECHRNTNNSSLHTNVLTSVGGVGRVRRNYKGETSLHIAAIKGDINRVKQIIAKNSYDIDTTDFAGWTPIHEASNKGFISIVEELLKAGSNVNARGYNNDTPLIDAAVNGHHLIVELLLKYGADYTLINNNNKSALDVAKTIRVVEVIHTFIDTMRKNGGNNKDIVTKSRSSSPSNGSSPSPLKSTSPRLTLRFQTIKDSKQSTTVTNTTNITSNTSMASTKSYSVSTPSDKEVSNDSNNDNKHNDSNRNNTSNGSTTECVTASTDHTYTSVDSTQVTSEDSNRSRKRRKSTDGSVSSTSSASGGPSQRSGSTSSVCSSTQSTKEWHNKKHHHQHQHQHQPHSHHHHLNHSNKSNNSKDKNVKKLFGSSSDSEVIDGSEDKESNPKDSSTVGSTETIAPKVPPLRIVLPANTSSTTSSSSALPTSNSTVPSSVTSSTTTSGAKFPYVVSSEESFQSEGESVSGAIGSQRITRSSQRVAQQQKSSNTLTDHHSDGEDTIPPIDSQHPRKRKIRSNNTNESKNNPNSVNTNGDNNDNDSSSSTSSVSVQKDISPFALPQTNCYQMFLSIRKNVDKKRKEMFSVPPKAPQGFDEYLLNRCSYELEGKSATIVNKNANNGSTGVNAMIKPIIALPPNSLSGSRMCEVFAEQERQRYKLKVQHLIERQKLVLSAEQEILRVHGRAARAMANQSVPFSVCSILKDEEIYNIFEPETEQNDSLSNHIKSDKPLVTPGTSGLSANRTRYNGRLFLSWLQDIDDKWEKIKENMILRHRKESESMFAMQRLEWEWKLKEFGLCDLKTSPDIEDKNVPKVQVFDDFELFPV